MCDQQQTHFTLWDVGRQRLEVTFDQGPVVSDAGLLAIRAMERPLGILTDVTPSVQRFVSVLEVFRSRVVRVFVWQTAGNQAWPRALVSCRADTPRPRHRSLRGAAARPAAPGPRSLHPSGPRPPRPYRP